MVIFSHRDLGTAEQAWAGAPWITAAAPLDLDDLARLIIVAAHPDDETLGAGGLLSGATRRGIPVDVLVLSDGEASHPESPTHSQGRLSRVRRTEVTDAVAHLAPSARLHFAGLPDGDLERNREAAARALASVLGPPSSGAETITEGSAAGTWIVAPWRADGHPDHALAGDVAAAGAAWSGARLLEYPIWAWHWSTPDGEWPLGLIRRFDLSPEDHARKLQALALHRSQVLPLSDEPGDEAVVPPAMAAHFARGFEIFVDGTAAEAPSPDASGTASLARSFFDEFYREARDPWGFETRWYERRKRALTLAALPRERFGAALELGCSIGVLTADLAARCDTVMAVDIAEQPLSIARERLAGRPGVRFARMTLPGEWPSGVFDLIVVSEVGYYLATADLERFFQRCRGSLAPGGVLLACHWRHPVPEYPLSGDRVHDMLATVPGLVRTVEHRESDFLLEVWQPEPARSVAQHEGLVP
ncbi:MULTISPECIES: bifunctional PIG-L family deacetylase/class I SAM-dependent methyltransferase [unclassified Cryobacterium]|uniref:bifunctional PIG-L family deacetylase/class I SAM-dependent methyltransferase n=2 Tax=Cryobacterium TaxID=69578 RepID=UPI002AB50472|nr:MULTISPECIES: bifunctional PIG-L family deacetylase/class I SAM-dependent methyltransferase [unclassified Cryobacterium]MDY7528218.1 bifunctional PIG-L family deacetylase/class I SAM-dependent methyltransferase [Cryobacterium sp. 10C2]MEB0200899.1 bifunctional PIG-L family deacetylase/class I SAM-dependent methyltransferase [Cryobacterium sp. 5I3]MEB0289283.1 bifunctional PIG-L family deacetylase/class I SAM-dependent methyltransferase [Cryobacterium sp. 10C2]